MEQWKLLTQAQQLFNAATMNNMSLTHDSIQWLSGGVTSPQGFAAGAARGGLKTQGDDVALIISQAPATCAAVFTRNRVRAAPVLVCAQHAEQPKARAIVVNAGNANCCTGTCGERDARRMCQLAAQKLGCHEGEVLVCSTGIIGHALPMDKIEAGIQAVELGRSQAADETAARAIMTTDTRPKLCAAQIEINGQTVTVGGTAKGAGMIGPDMGPLSRNQAAGGRRRELHATMLAFLTTDAQIEKPLLQEMLKAAVGKSFNSVTVDGDTSTNDTALLLANGASGAIVDESNRAQFEQLLEAVCIRLTQEIARDGEGATKLVTVQVEGAENEADAKQIAMTVANSPLVKTAIFGRDPNWGRIAAAAGRAGILFDDQLMSIDIGGIRVFLNGEPANFSQTEAEAAMSRDELKIRIALGEGQASWTAWTCDFSYDYVKINAEYHT